MKKNTNRQPRARLQSLDAAQLAQVAGGVCSAKCDMVNALWDMAGEPGTAWYTFCTTAAGTLNTGYSSTPIP